MPILTKEDFGPAMGSKFAASHDGLAFELTLVGVRSDGDIRFPGSLRDPFTLQFETASPVPQGTYTFWNAVIGEHPIFVVPVARTEAGFRHEAAFN